MKESSRGFIGGLVAIILAAAALGGSYVFYNNQKNQNLETNLNNNYSEDFVQNDNFDSSNVPKRTNTNNTLATTQNTNSEQQTVSKTNNQTTQSTTNSEPESQINASDPPVDENIFINAKSELKFDRNYDGVFYYNLSITGANDPQTKWFLNVDCPDVGSLKVNGSNKICGETLILNSNDGKGNLLDTEIAVENPTDNDQTVEFWIKAYNQNERLLANFSEKITYGITRPSTIYTVNNEGSSEETWVMDGSPESKKVLVNFYVESEGDATLKEIGFSVRGSSPIGKEQGDETKIIDKVYLYDKKTGETVSKSVTGENEMLFGGLNIYLSAGEKHRFSFLADINDIDTGYEILNYWKDTALYTTVQVDMYEGIKDANLNKMWPEPNQNFYKTIKFDITNSLRQEWMG